MCVCVCCPWLLPKALLFSPDGRNQLPWCCSWLCTPRSVCSSAQVCASSQIWEQFSASHFLVAVITWLDHVWSSFPRLSKGDGVPKALSHPCTVLRQLQPPCFGQGCFQGGWRGRGDVCPFWQGLLLLSSMTEWHMNRNRRVAASNN